MLAGPSDNSRIGSKRCCRDALGAMWHRPAIMPISYRDAGVDIDAGKGAATHSASAAIIIVLFIVKSLCLSPSSDVWG